MNINTYPSLKTPWALMTDLGAIVSRHPSFSAANAEYRRKWEGKADPPKCAARECRRAVTQGKLCASCKVDQAYFGTLDIR